MSDGANQRIAIGPQKLHRNTATVEVIETSGLINAKSYLPFDINYPLHSYTWNVEWVFDGEPGRYGGHGTKFARVHTFGIYKIQINFGRDIHYRRSLRSHITVHYKSSGAASYRCPAFGLGFFDKEDFPICPEVDFSRWCFKKTQGIETQPIGYSVSSVPLDTLEHFDYILLDIPDVFIWCKYHITPIDPDEHERPV